MSTESVHQFGIELVADFERRGLDDRPEVFPGRPDWNHYGDWLRLLGRHHTRNHFTRVWNDEPWAEQAWLEGDDAIERILRTQPASVELSQANGIVRFKRTICLDFDGVIHSYRSGWCGVESIPDPPIHGTREAIDRLRRNYRVVVHSARTATEEGVNAVQRWLDQHGIEVDEVCRYKPPASIYVDDRAIPFRGNWNETIGKISDFRR